MAWHLKSLSPFFVLVILGYLLMGRAEKSVSGRSGATSMTSLRYATVVSIAALICASAIARDPVLFDAGQENQAGLVFTPDGNTGYWAAWNGAWGDDATSPRTIYSSRLKDGTWTEPAMAPFSGTFNDDDPYVSPDGRWLYFVSDRPASDVDDQRDGDIWRYSLSGDNVLQRLDINSDAADYSPMVSGSGTLYFASDRDGGLGQGDLYRAAPVGSGFGPAEPLGPSVNSRHGEWNLWVAADDNEILFEASARPSNVSVPGDLYYSWRTEAGWVAAMPVSRINSKGSDLLPRMHPDGSTLYYTSAAIGGHAQILSTDWEPIKRELRAAYAPPLLIANRSSHDVVFVDLASGQVTRRIATGEGPHLLSNVDVGRVLATGFGEFPEPHAAPVSARPPFKQLLNSRLTVLDARTGSVLLETRLEDCARPHASWIVGDRGFITCQDEQSVLEIDLETGNPVQRFDTRQQGTHVLAFDPGSRMLAASNTDSGSVSLIDIDTGNVRIVELGAGSEGAVENDGLFWVANALEGSVSVIDPTSAKVLVQTEPLCSFPIALSPDQRNGVWVACFGSAELIAIDRESFRVTRRHQLDGQPLNILVHPDRHIAYTSLPRENAVAEIDLESGAVLRRIPTGIEPDGVRWVR
jgi:streptogramin lyase